MANSQTYSHRKLSGFELNRCAPWSEGRKRSVARVRQFLAIISFRGIFRVRVVGRKRLILGAYVGLGLDDVNLEKISCFSLMTC